MGKEYNLRVIHILKRQITSLKIIWWVLWHFLLFFGTTFKSYKSLVLSILNITYNAHDSREDWKSSQKFIKLLVRKIYIFTHLLLKVLQCDDSFHPLDRVWPLLYIIVMFIIIFENMRAVRGMQMNKKIITSYSAI